MQRGCIVTEPSLSVGLIFGVRFCINVVSLLAQPDKLMRLNCTAFRMEFVQN